MVKPLTTWGNKNVQKFGEWNGSAMKGRLVNRKNEMKVHPKGRCNPPDGAIEESVDVLQQDLLIVLAINTTRNLQIYDWIYESFLVIVTACDLL